MSAPHDTAAALPAPGAMSLARATLARAARRGPLHGSTPAALGAPSLVLPPRLGQEARERKADAAAAADATGLTVCDVYNWIYTLSGGGNGILLPLCTFWIMSGKETDGRAGHVMTLCLRDKRV